MWIKIFLNMGVIQLFPFVQSTFCTGNVSESAGKNVGIDDSCFLNKAFYSNAKDDEVYASYVEKLVQLFLQNENNNVFLIFDGKSLSIKGAVNREQSTKWEDNLKKAQTFIANNQIKEVFKYL